VLKRAYRWVNLEVRVYRFAYDDPRTPKKDKGLLRFVFVCFLSPIDLIPDFIPIIGILDEIILFPGRRLIVRRLVANEVIADCRRRAEEDLALPASRGTRQTSGPAPGE